MFKENVMFSAVPLVTKVDIAVVSARTTFEKMPGFYESSSTIVLKENFERRLWVRVDILVPRSTDKSICNIATTVRIVPLRH